MDACIVIPARYASTRYPGKPLVALTGAGGVARTLIERSVMAARAASGGVIPIYVATDDARIAEEARRIGAEVIMTSESCRNGTERVAEAVATAGITADIVVNLQGDAPLTPAHFVTALIEAMRADPGCGMATPYLRCDAETVENLLAGVGAMTNTDAANLVSQLLLDMDPMGGTVMFDGAIDRYDPDGIVRLKRTGIRRS